MAQASATRGSGEDLSSADVIIIGGGFAGLYAHYRLRRLELKLQGFEAAPGVGGTWYWNAYPGARCDVESLNYCYSFSPELLDEWVWSERFATQPEILRYANHVADRFDLRRDIDFGTKVQSCDFNEAANRWIVETDSGKRVAAQFVIAATGCLSDPMLPDIPGIADFKGRVVQTSLWPHEGVDLAGKRVGVIGTGSSGIQAIPVIAESAKQLTVFQRTPNYSIPARNGPVDPDMEAELRADYIGHARRNRYTQIGFEFRMPPNMPAGWTPGGTAREATEAERRAAWDALWESGGTGFAASYTDLTTDPEANRHVAEFVRDKIRKIVKDPATAERLCPFTYPFGTKRICLDSDYFETFNRPNVALVDLRETPIEAIAADGVRTSAETFPLEVLVFATGFDAVTGPLLQVNYAGRGGVRLRDAWADGPHTYLGLMVADFPNLFTVTGPESPSVLTNMLPSIEQHVDWIADCIAYMRERGFDRIEPDSQAQREWGQEVRAAAAHSLYLQADSWYMGANVPGKPRAILPYMGGLGAYTERCDKIAGTGYPGFSLTSTARREAVPAASVATDTV